MAKIIDIKLLVRLTLKKWYLFAAVAVVSLFAAMVLTSEVRPDVYQASTTISSIAEGSSTDSLNGFRLLMNYSGLITSDKIATVARNMLPDSLGISSRQIQAMITPVFDDASSILYIRCGSSNPQLALSVANAVAEAFVAEIGSITGDDTIRIYDRATNVSLIYNGEAEQRKTRVTAPAVSVFAMVVAVVLWALFSDRVKSVGEAELGGEITVIGAIPRI